MIAADGSARKAWYNQKGSFLSYKCLISTSIGAARMPASRSQRRRQPARSQPRRPVIRTREPADYTLDYMYVRRDLMRILLWGGLLFVGMIAVSFVI
jgi:hypothetical protein